MALIEKKDDLKARVELLKAAKYKSDKVEVWRALAGIDERTKASSSLFVDLRRIVELDPNDLNARLKLARIMVGGGAADAALRVIDAANEGDKPNAELHALRAIILLRTNDNPGAIREAERAYEINPTNVDAITLLASKKVADGDLDGALKLLDSVPAGSKDETRVTLQKIDAYARKKDLVKAEELLRKLIAQNPQEAAYHAQLLQLLLAQRKFVDAEKELRARAEANPTDNKIGLDLVRFLAATKGVDAGRAELEARIKAGGDDFDYQIALAELNHGQNRTADAVQALQRLASTAATPDKKLAAQVKLAEIYVSKGEKAAAEPLIADILAKDRRNGGALRMRAALSIDKGQFDSAISDLREALNDQPKSVELLSLMAVAYERSGKGELADRQYADALKSSNFNPDIVLRYVTFLQRKGDATRAEEILTEAANRNSTNLQIWSSLGQVRLRRQNWSGALAIADAIGRVDAGRVAADQIRAAALAGQNKIEESVAVLEAAHKAAPDAPQPALALASAYVKQGKPDKAAALLQRLSDNFPANAQLLVFLGQAKLAEKKNDEALQSFKTAVAQQPKEPAGYTALTEFYIQRKNYDEADRVLKAGLAELPGNVAFRLSLAGLQIMRGNNEPAISQYEAILQDQPNSLVAINNLVNLLLDNRSDKPSLERAFELSEKLKSSNVPQFQDTWGWAQYKRGDVKGAIDTLEAAVPAMSNLAVVHYHLGMSYAAAGQTEKAAERLKTAFSLEPDGTPLKESIRSAMK
ncbi:tetratricopeptide repeat protein [Bradyrhizobium sp. sBnM-33]|uniref:tetratricopeptide repeat protein n=1 Tax=Bradyrhizobium sp. sBnM-33 TaxID=2831780 RepID=UPI001BCB273B|nr:tetratricopeptide repeat protein [Bradyrhizobium sp. sBnM-33]WOH53734.1 tetratricopeptide repeat protein [Bradyrhizobium sp. sBnM-33]